VDEAYMRSQKLEPKDDWNYAHNLSYFIANSSEEGRAKEALEYAAKLEPLAKDPAGSDNPGFYVVQIGGTWSRLAIRFGKWDEAIRHPANYGIAEDKLPLAAKALRDGMVTYARAMQALEREDTAGAELAADRLDAFLWRLMRERTAKSDSPDPKAKALAGTAQRVEGLLGVASRELAGNLESHRGHFGRAKVLLEQAVEAEQKLGYAEPPVYSRPALESLGYACIRAGKWDDARAAFQKVLAARPHSGFGYYGIALAWQKQGNQNEATKAWADFKNAWQYADSDLPMLQKP